MDENGCLCQREAATRLAMAFPTRSVSFVMASRGARLCAVERNNNYASVSLSTTEKGSFSVPPFLRETEGWAALLSATIATDK
ncbi:Dgri\GH22342-PA-like protein [Anopheles sinensis]|uniref:Dgri\GH22342-PA-like protein n=1 Tax=Anopheles sinensis TaxID=74873 RepID=A0A084W9I8_ANOSI|nr:Dgri\GH22342-PA-like protein [Anopheles sinensis]